MTDEDFYVANIKSELDRLGKLCQERGLPFLAHVQFQGTEEPIDEYPQGAYDGETTRFLPDTTSLSLRWAWYAIQCKGNIDSFFFAVMRDAKEHVIDTTGSLVLSQVFGKRS